MSSDSDCVTMRRKDILRIGQLILPRTGHPYGAGGVHSIYVTQLSISKVIIIRESNVSGGVLGRLRVRSQRRTLSVLAKSTFQALALLAVSAPEASAIAAIRRSLRLRLLLASSLPTFTSSAVSQASHYPRAEFLRNLGCSRTRRPPLL